MIDGPLSAGNRAPYDPARIDARCHEAWRQKRPYVTPPETPGQVSTFVYACTPFTTGQAHMGHVRSYTIADACARRARSRGDAVLWAMGFDAFGLPNEIAAIEHGTPPNDWVRACRERMTEQFERLGLSVDWSRVFDTSDPEYYRWTQWVFLRFFERGLVYRADGIENWCDTCHTVLAALQVSDNGHCWRCDGPVRLACVPQWYLRLQPYAEELEAGLSVLQGWDEAVLNWQRVLLGKTHGIEFDVPIPSGPPLTVFTQYPDAIGKAAFIAVSPNHPDLEGLIARDRSTLDLDGQRRRSLRRSERSARRIPVAQTDRAIRIPGFYRDLPIVVTPAVDMRFGGGAALGVPGCDEIDLVLANQLELAPVVPDAGAPAVVLHATTRYRLRDNSISRQRSWGAPVPVIHCATCGQVGVRDTDLPVRLPVDLVPTAKDRGGALGRHSSFSDCVCPRCEEPARRDTDTLDVHVDSIWMLVPFCVPAADRSEQMFTHPELRRWLPVAQVVCGADQAGWWLNDRFCFKVLHDAGYFSHLKDREPVQKILMHEMVLANGRKMSKSLGNAVDPDDVVRRYGADAVRLTVLKVNPRKAFNWSEDSLRENYRFLADVWDFAVRFRASSESSGSNRRAPLDSSRLKLDRWRDVAVRKVTSAYDDHDFHVVLQQLKIFFESIRRFAAQRQHTGQMTSMDRTAIATALEAFLGLLEPLAPHLVDELLRNSPSEKGNAARTEQTQEEDSSPVAATPASCNAVAPQFPDIQT